MGGIFAGPATFGGPAVALKKSEKGVPGGFFLTSNMHKIHFGDPAGGSKDALPRPL